MATDEHRVLVVDDDSAIREVVGEVLHDAGYEVVCACNGREALEYLRHGPTPCMILLDVMMPVMDGRQFREEQVRDRELGTIPTVVLTAGGPSSAALVPADEVLEKPVSLDGLLHTIERHCSAGSHQHTHH